MTSIASSASEVKVQHRSLLIERGYEEFTGRLDQILGRFVASKLKGLTPDGAMEALKSMEGEQGFMIINIFDHGADLLMVGQRRKAKQYLIGNPLVAIQITRYDIRAALYAPLRVLCPPLVMTWASSSPSLVARSSNSIRLRRFSVNSDEMKSPPELSRVMESSIASSRRPQ